MVEKVTEDNVITVFAKYAEDHHTPLLDETAPKSPVAEYGGEAYTRLSYVWALYQAVIPSTGRYMAEEFARKYIDDPDLAAKLCRSTNPVIDGFETLGDKGDNIIVRGVLAAKRYRITVGPLVRKTLKPGLVKIGLIHPWDADGTHMMDIVMNADMSDLVYPDSANNTAQNTRMPPGVPWLDVATIKSQIGQDWQRTVESIKLTPRSKLAPALKKYPGHWTNEMCHEISVKPAPRHPDRSKDISKVLTSDKISDVLAMLPDTYIECIKHVATSGGFVRFKTLEDAFGPDDTDYYWNGFSRTVIGSLRRTGILIVGKKTTGSKDYKVIGIASDVLENLNRIGLADGTQDADSTSRKPGSKKTTSRGTRQRRKGALSKDDKGENGDKSRSWWHAPKWLTRNRVKM